ncbi:unnamed protein product [Brassica rapa]|uniref:Uncharacterized protein n=2 Tax=Brassica TaxID=3705 RepID=A0A8D9HBV5_BRACM|nr:unnamed protein product [Brassica napus]CAG7896488.1 unnamed protein product [Brassica rapa]
MLRRTRLGIAASRQPAKKSFTSKRELSRRTDIPNTSSSTPKASQGRLNKKTVTSGDKEKHNRRRRHELVSMEPLVRYSQRTSTGRPN